MDKYIAIYVPSLDIDGKEIDEVKREKALEQVEKYFLDSFEVFIESELRYGWVGEGGTVSYEEITVVKSFYDVQSNATVRGHVRELVGKLKTLLNQDYISVEQNGDLEFI